MRPDEPVLRNIASAAEISEARAAIRRLAADLDPEIGLAAELVSSELLANALLHGGGAGDPAGTVQLPPEKWRPEAVASNRGDLPVRTRRAPTRASDSWPERQRRI